MMDNSNIFIDQSIRTRKNGKQCVSLLCFIIISNNNIPLASSFMALFGILSDNV